MTVRRWLQIEKLYYDVLDRDPQERVKFLAEQCRHDADLQSEVASLLAVDSSGRTLDRQAWESATECASSASTSFQLVEGTRIDSYQVEASLGSGGMGSVYLATDNRLRRPVAIKFLINYFGAIDADASPREAQMASCLNHPNIITVYDVGEFQGYQYLVTEFVDGGTLHDWATRQERSWQEAVEILVGVAEGLAAAHEAGILHRDIKPANILVTKNGYAKLADFGLAKLADGAVTKVSSVVAVSQEHRSAVAGTINYMSPEQALGKPLDARSDIFSFGLVLYEMIAHRRPFRSAGDWETLERMIHQAPQPLGDHLPLVLRRATEKALAKAPAERYQTMRELALDLRRVLRMEVTPDPIAPYGTSKRTWLPRAAAAITAVLGFGIWASLHRSGTAPENPLASATYTRLTGLGGTQLNPVISPDGKQIAFISEREGNFDLWLGKTTGEDLVNLTNGQGGDLLAPLRNIGFSWDGSQIWNGGGKGRQLRMIPVTGGTFHNFLGSDAAEVAWSPDGKHLVFHSWRSGDPLFIGDRDGRHLRPLVPAAISGEHQHYQVWSKDSRWIWFARGQPATREMDLWRVSVNGGEAERMSQLKGDIADPTPLDARTILYTAHDEDGGGPWLWALDSETHLSQRVSTGVEQYSSIAGSADAHRLVASLVNSQVNLWSVPILDRPAEELQVKPFQLPTLRALMPRFANASLFYLSSRGGADGLWQYRDGKATEIWKGADGALQTPPAVSPDGSRVAITIRRNGRNTLHLLSESGHQVRVLATEITIRGSGSWSPDGKWIVVAGTNVTGPGLYKIPADGHPPVQILSGNALDPVWSPSGNLIVYGGTNMYTEMPLLGIKPDGTPLNLPPISVRREGERARFLPDGNGLVYMQGTAGKQDFWLLNLHSMQRRPLTRLSDPAQMRSFDITPDGRQIVFDRSRESSEIVVIDLATRP